MKPQTIQIFLPDGNPRGVKIAEITTRVVQAIAFPRKELLNLGKRDELKNVGMYFLFGEDESKSKQLAYIGEAEDCYDRIKNHKLNKEFWTHAIVFISQKNAFTKGHVKFLEHLAIKQAKTIGRYDMTKNEVTPRKPHVTESMEADLLDSYDTIKILLSSLGHPVLEEFTAKEKFVLEGRGVKAEGSLDNDGFLVFEGSEATLDSVQSCLPSLVSMRMRLVEEEVLKEENGKYLFASKYLFGSPSTAAGVVLGRNSNGWQKWKSSDGKTLDELKRQ